VLKMGRRSNKRRKLLRNRKKACRRGKTSTANGSDNNNNVKKSQDNDNNNTFSSNNNNNRTDNNMNNNNTSYNNNEMRDNNNNNSANNGTTNNDERKRDSNNNNTSYSSQDSNNKNNSNDKNMKKRQENNNNNTSNNNNNYSNNKMQDNNNDTNNSYNNNTNSTNHNNNNNNANNVNNNHNSANPNHNTSLNDGKKKKKKTKKKKKKVVNARTSDVLKEKMLRTHKPHRTPYAMRPRDRKCMTCQKDEKTLGRKLRRCGKCGLAAYCDTACQKEHRVVHKAYCEFWSNQNTPDRANGERCILFDRTFGGYYSLYQGHSYRQYGVGILVATLSHAAADFVAIKDPDRKDKRTITFSYVRQSQIPVFLSNLSMERKNANSVNEEKECFASAVVAGLEAVSKLSKNIEKGMFFVLVLKSPERQPVEVHVMQVVFQCCYYYYLMLSLI